MEASSAYTFFIDVIVPNAVNRYQVDNANQITSAFSAIPESSEPLVVDILMKCIRDYAFTLPKVISNTIVCCVNSQNGKSVHEVINTLRVVYKVPTKRK